MERTETIRKKANKGSTKFTVKEAEEICREWNKATAPIREFARKKRIKEARRRLLEKKKERGSYGKLNL